MDTEAIRARMAGLEEDAARLVEMHAQIIGALEDCRYWLERIEAQNEAQAQAGAQAPDGNLPGV